MVKLFKKRVQIPRYSIFASISLLFIGFIIWRIFTTDPISTMPIRNEYGIAFSDIGTYSPSTLDTRLQDTAKLGFKWIRLDFTWSNLQAHNAKLSNWAVTDRVVAAASKYHLKVLGVIDYTPAWARQTSCLSGTCAPADPTQFATFAAQVATRYQSKGVSYWEIWNEENIARFWQPLPSPSSYAQLLIQSYKAIKKAVPGAFVLLGGMSSSADTHTNIDAVTFLKQLYAFGVKGYFDAIAYHPYTYPSGPSEKVASWRDMNSLASLMLSEGDGRKQIWITEYGAPTNGPDSTHVSEVTQASFARDAVDYLKLKSWAGPFFWYTYADATSTSTTTNEHFFGLRRADGTPKAAYAAWQKLLAE